MSQQETVDFLKMAVYVNLCIKSGFDTGALKFMAMISFLLNKATYYTRLDNLGVAITVRSMVQIE
jgi:hypothetical protein